MRKHHFRAASGGDVQVEQQRLTVLRRNLPQLVRHLLGRTIGRLTVGHVQNGRRIRAGMRLAPADHRPIRSGPPSL
jgi:hypothetical protein